MVDDDDAIHAGIRAGARGYVLKGSQPTEILQAILAVAGAKRYSARVAAGLERLLAHESAAARADPGTHAA